MTRKHKTVFLGVTVSLFAFLFVLLNQEARAIPAFARKYETSCQTCHVAFPKLNSFGEAFRNNGYRFPGGDEAVIKREPVVLGAPAWKKVWPQAVWPADIPYSIPLALLITNRFEIMPDNEVKSDFIFPNEVELFSGGTIGESVSFYGGLTLLDKNEFGGLHRLFGQFNGLGGSPLLNVKFGGFEPRATPFSSHRRLTLTNYAMNDLAVNSSQVTDGEIVTGHGHGGGTYSLGTSQRGIELWGATSGPGGGGLEWAFGVTNGNGLGGAAPLDPVVDDHDDDGHEEGEEDGDHDAMRRLSGLMLGPLVEGEHGAEEEPEGAGEHGANTIATLDDNSSKDIYARFSYKFFGYGRTGTTGPTIDDAQNWVDDSFRVGVFASSGSAKNPFGSPEPESYRRYGVDVDLWFKDLNLYGAYMFGKNEIKDHDGSRSFDLHSWFVEADYVLLPWVVAAFRYEAVNVKPLTTGNIELSDRIPIMRRVVPHVTLLLRSNVKLAFETNQYFNDYANELYRVNLDFAF